MRMLRNGRGAALAVAWVLAAAGSADELHSALCLHGCPAGSAETNDVLVRSIYVLSSNDTTKFADWVAYRVTEGSIGATQDRRWKADPELAERETLEPDDYRRANAVLKTDRGHQAPLASFTGTEDWETTNYLSNITPQKSALNQGPWKDLEEAERDLAKARGKAGVYVVTGPLHERGMPRMPEADEAHLVPSGSWKVVGVEDGDDIRLAAFVFDQETARRESHCDGDKRARLREVETRTGLDFMHGLDAGQQDALELGEGTLFEELGCGLQ